MTKKLTEISGIGEATEKKLLEIGITTPDELAEKIDDPKVEEIFGLNFPKIAALFSEKTEISESEETPAPETENEQKAEADAAVKTPENNSHASAKKGKFLLKKNLIFDGKTLFAEKDELPKELQKDEKDFRTRGFIS
jgi:nucleotidyltransferase/DNA polymerase involved in DNA repair